MTKTLSPLQTSLLDIMPKRGWKSTAWLAKRLDCCCLAIWNAAHSLAIHRQLRHRPPLSAKEGHHWSLPQIRKGTRVCEFQHCISQRFGTITGYRISRNPGPWQGRRLPVVRFDSGFDCICDPLDLEIVEHVGQIPLPLEVTNEVP